MRPSDVSPVHGVGPISGLAKQTLGGKIALAAWHQRRAPAVALRSAMLAARDRSRPDVPERPPRRFRAVYVIPVGPGEWDALADTIASIRHHEGDDVKIVVADDGTHDARRAVVRERYPSVSVIRQRWPTCGPPRQSHMLCRIFEWAVLNFDFDVLCKIDADALVTGPQLADRAAAAFAADPSLGLLGSHGIRADGVAEDYSYDAWVLAHERRWSVAVRGLHEAALAGGFDGAKVHGGVYLMRRSALVDAQATGRLCWRPPWWTLLSEDIVLTLIICATGYRVGSWGAPGEPIASGQGFLPIAAQRVLDEGVLAVHSVRRGIGGETEAQLRAFFAADRRR